MVSTHLVPGAAEARGMGLDGLNGGAAARRHG
jgi:hypothetical protein